MTRLWDKNADVDELVLRFTVGDDHLLDARLVEHDVRASIAHGAMLSAQGYLEEDDFRTIEQALTAIGEAHQCGDWQIAVTEEDVHTALENRLVAEVGAAGKRLHLGRSRNDQVLTALRLYLRDTIDQLTELGNGVVTALDSIVRSQGEIPLPGYTHMQRAMPSSVGLWAGGFQAEIQDNVAALERVKHRIARCPLGSAAGYGVPVVNIDRAATAEALGFCGPHEPVTAVQLSRGKGEAALLFELTLMLQDLGRLASDLCLFATSEFGFVRLPEKFTTGSSIMPQKRNPDIFELVRARAATICADLNGVLGVTNKLPSGYQRDLQLIKAPLFRGIDTAMDTLALMAHVLPEVEFVRAKTEAALDPGLYATEQAIRLVVEEGLPFREAYRRVAARHG